MLIYFNLICITALAELTLVINKLFYTTICTALPTLSGVKVKLVVAHALVIKLSNDYWPAYS